MAELTPDFVPYSDIAISDEETIASHTEYIKNGQYSEAKTVVDNDTNMEKKGFRASFFNAIETKIQELQIYLLNKQAAPDEYYSLTEPTEAEMEGKLYWIKPVT